MSEATPEFNLKLIREGLSLLEPKTQDEQNQINKLIDWFSEDSLKYRIKNTFMANPNNIVQATKICRIMTGASLIPCLKHVNNVIE